LCTVLALFDCELTILARLGTLAPNLGAFPLLMALSNALFLAVAPAFTTTVRAHSQVAIACSRAVAADQAALGEAAAEQAAEAAADASQVSPDAA
jgi:hypothetical protein